jgi:malic enzyme
MLGNQRGFVVSAIAALGATIGTGLVAAGVGATAAATIGGIAATGLVVGGIGAAAWGATALMSGGSKKSQMHLQQTPGTPQFEDAKSKAAEDQKRRRLQIADAGGTNLTSPMGLTTSKPSIERKTLLGS